MAGSSKTEVSALSAINMRLRDDYIRDASGGMKRWNTIIEKTACQFEMKLPHEGFHRQIGTFAEAAITPEGEVISAGGMGRPARTNGCQPPPMAISSSR